MIKCPSCGHENVDGTQFCEMCGEELGAANASQAAAPAAGAAPAGAATSDAGGMIKCPACDNMNPADNVVCEVCGTELRPGALGGAAPTALASGAVSADTPSATPATTPFDTATPDPSAAPAATATNTDASLPTVAISSADPLANDPLASAPDSSGAATAPVTSLDDDATALPAVTPAADATAPASGGSLEPGKVKLVVEQGMTVGKQFVLGDTEVLVGREDDEEGIYPDIDLSDQDEGYVHRKHATLTFAGGGLSVTHLGGANKTRVNNKPLADNMPQPVNIGDKVAFGKVVMRVQSN